MTATGTGAGIGLQKEKATGEGGNPTGATGTARLGISAEDVKSEADRYLMRWLRNGADYYRRLARAASDAARKS